MLLARYSENRIDGNSMTRSANAAQSAGHIRIMVKEIELTVSGLVPDSLAEN